MVKPDREISGALSEVRRRQVEAESKAKQEREQCAKETYGKIGAIIEALRVDPQYVVHSMNKKNVTIRIGTSFKLDNLPEAAANFLGKQQPLGNFEMLKIRAYEDAVGRNMEFVIEDQEGNTLRWVRLNTVSKLTHKAVGIECALNTFPKDTSALIVYASGRIGDLGKAGWQDERLETVKALVDFGKRETIQTIQQRH